MKTFKSFMVEGPSDLAPNPDIVKAIKKDKEEAKRRKQEMIATREKNLKNYQQGKVRANWVKEEVMAEASIVKKIKRAAQGWGMFDKDTPGDIISKTRGQDTDTLKFLQRKPGQKSGAHSPQDLQAKAIDRELKHRGVAEGEYDHSELYNGCYVRDEQDGANGEVFRMSGDPEDRRVRIEDKDGRGWYISPHRLQLVDENDPAVARWFGNSRDEDDLAEGDNLATFVGPNEDSTDVMDHRGAVTDSFTEDLARIKTLALSK